MRTAAALALLVTPMFAASLAQNIRRLIDSTPGARTAFWGIQVVDLATGKTLHYPQNDDGPPISALTLTDNALTLRVEPGAAIGEPAALAFNPAIEFYDIENRVRTVAAGSARRIQFKRIPGSRYAQLW